MHLSQKALTRLFDGSAKRRILFPIRDISALDAFKPLSQGVELTVTSCQLVVERCRIMISNKRDRCHLIILQVTLPLTIKETNILLKSQLPSFQDITKQHLQQHTFTPTPHINTNRSPFTKSETMATIEDLLQRNKSVLSSLFNL
jgi:hypothetical protein